MTAKQNADSSPGTRSSRVTVPTGNFGQNRADQADPGNQGPANLANRADQDIMDPQKRNLARDCETLPVAHAMEVRLVPYNFRILEISISTNPSSVRHRRVDWSLGSLQKEFWGYNRNSLL